MELDLHTKQQLADLLAKPAMVTQAHAVMLTDLVKSYPYFQPLHLLLARANHHTLQKDHLATAALYNGGGLLHQVVYQPESLTYRDIKLVNANKFAANQPNTFITPAATPVETIAPEPEVYEEIAEVTAPTVDLIPPVSTESNLVNEDHHQKLDVETIDQEKDEQEVFEEIVELNQASFSSLVAADMPPSPQEAPAHDELDDLEMESIVATDFFAFEQKMDPEAVSAAKPIAPPEEYNVEAEEQNVSKYYDEKLPYTFLWWLAKTRKEHEQIFQPYVTAKKNSNIGLNPLHQQYVEHIFHLQTPFNEAEEMARGPINKAAVHKDAAIIDSFIRNEPQIRPPKGDQLNNENKAKKSAQDNYDLVSETLASIYIEQMLYHKAIDTYEKLSLKFPEKSRYFADLIQSLEKKI